MLSYFSLFSSVLLYRDMDSRYHLAPAWVSYSRQLGAMFSLLTVTLETHTHVDLKKENKNYFICPSSILVLYKTVP